MNNNSNHITAMIITIRILIIHIYIYTYIHIFVRFFIFKFSKSISSSRSTNNSPCSKRSSHRVIGYFSGQRDLGIGAGVGVVLSPFAWCTAATFHGDFGSLDQIVAILDLFSFRCVSGRVPHPSFYKSYSVQAWVSFFASLHSKALKAVKRTGCFYDQGSNISHHWKRKNIFKIAN